MKKALLLVLTAAMLLLDYFYSAELRLHASFDIMVLFFSVQTFVLWRMESLVTKEWQVQLSLVKIAVRLLSSLVLITVLLLTQDQKVSLTLQFVGLYLGYMIFEIVFSLTNLRRN